ncbi:MAG: hypothetical protein ABFS24_03095, partial [Pseudomonadota bacterium]
MFRTSFSRIAHKALALVACTGAILALAAGPVSAAHNTTLTISKASWNDKKSELTIEGRAEAGFEVFASNAADVSQSLGSDIPGNNQRYKIVVAGPISPFPCAVHVEQWDGVELGIVEAPVANAPPECQGGQNLPPICTINTPTGDTQILVGESIDYTATANDPDGTVEAWSWIIQGGDTGGTDALFAVEDPGPVTYDTAGVFTTSFDATDNEGANCQPPASRTITVIDPGSPEPLPNQTDFKMMMNYELGMHCTGFEFAYCCVLPAYNSILTQVVKPQNGVAFPHLLEEAPNHNVDPIPPVGTGTGDVLGRHTVVRDKVLDDNGNFSKYVLRYWHDAQPRNDGNGKVQGPDRKISAVEGNSLLAWNTVADAADLNPDGTFKLSDATDGDTSNDYDGVTGVVLGNGDYTDVGATFGVPIDNYQNVVWNHLYIYTDTEGNFACTAGDTDKHCYALSDDPDAECDSAPGAGDGVCGINSTDANKARLGLHVDYPTNFGPAGHKMEGLLTFSGDTGTVVFTQMKVLENLPVMLTSPRIWEALGLTLTPFEDSIDFFANPGLVDEDSIRPFVEMKAQLYYADCDDVTGVCTEGAAVLDSAGNDVVGFGTAPIDIPNCERCHSAFNTPNSPNVEGTAAADLVHEEIDFWNAYYEIDTIAGDSDWYSRLKGAAISMMNMHDVQHGTDFTTNYPGTGALRPAQCVKGDVGANCSLHSDCDTAPGNGQCDIPQNTRIGHESVICQKCHADNVIAVVKSANCGPHNGNPDVRCSASPADELFSNIAPTDPVTGAGHLIKPLTESLHWNHRETSEGGTITMTDASGRSGGCQGCHPAHRSDGDMSGYPITLDGDNFYANSDNRDANGGCFVGRDVHSNPAKDIDGAETPSHLNAVGQWLQTNVANDSGNWKGIWCTNCHSQAGQQMWKAENVESLVHAQPGDDGHVREPFEGAGLSDVVAAVNAALGTTTTLAQFESWLDPKDPGVSPTVPSGANRLANDNSAIWAPDPGMCNHAASLLGLGEASPYQDGNVATIEIALGSTDGSECSTGIGLPGPSCLGEPGGAPSFYICGSLDADNDVSVSLLDFCTTSEKDVDGNPTLSDADCVGRAQAALNANPNADGTAAVPVPMSAATDGRDHWLSPGEPHCADCHAAPYVEQSGNINEFPPFNYPRKASLMRYSRGHQDITCQG